MNDFNKECPVCGGSGECATSHRYVCYDCDGTGRIRDEERYNKLVEQEREAWKQYEANLRASEYRQMGG